MRSDVALGAAYVVLGAACAHLMTMPRDTLEPVAVHRWDYTPEGELFTPWGNMTLKDTVAYMTYTWMLPTVLDAEMNSWTYHVEYFFNLRVLALYVMLVPSFLLSALPHDFTVSCTLGFLGSLATAALLIHEATSQSDVFYFFMSIAGLFALLCGGV